MLGCPAHTRTLVPRRATLSRHRHMDYKDLLAWQRAMELFLSQARGSLFELETQLVSAITRSSQAVTQARSAQGQLQELADARGELSERAQSLKAKVSGLLEGPKDGPGAKDQPTLKDNNSNVIALYKEVEKADAEPTAAAINAADKIHSELEPLLKRWEELKNGDLQKLNVKLSAADLPRIDFDRPPEHEEAGENEE